ncbi:MAG: M23 family metallopeptidase, partial [Gammaproteobacteria bacterium]
PGDSFEVVFRQSGDTPAEGDPRILAAEFTNQGHPYQAFWYQDDNGDGDYYTVSGQSVHESILRAPLRYDHISSRFSYHRMNPVLHIVRPHYGVDYAAPMGTPVKAAANGRIKFIGRDGGYGRLVVIESFGKYDTYYAHLHRFAHGLSRGTRVHQGEVIGYVGESGEATGPHLHYGIRVAGHWRDPRTVPLPKARPLPIDQLARFEDRIQPWLAMLDHPADVEIASGEPIDSRDTGSTSLRSAPSRHVMAR